MYLTESPGVGTYDNKSSRTNESFSIPHNDRGLLSSKIWKSPTPVSYNQELTPVKKKEASYTIPK